MARRRSSGITSLSFNQDQGCFTCCLKSGLRVYNVDPLVEKTHYSKEELGEVALCEMVFRTNWLLVVRARRPCCLLLVDDKRRVKNAEINFKTPIRALRSRKDKAAVVLSSSIQVLTIPALQRVALLRTPTNSRPLCALATEPNAAQILAAPAHRRGSLQVLDVSRAVKGAQSSSPAVVGCHLSPLVCLSVSPNGAKIATASARGTIIRIWDAITKHMLHELRRGSDYADIYCINFNPSGSVVCCVSDKGTLHIWAARGSYAHLASAHAEADTRALCAFTDDNSAIENNRVLCIEDNPSKALCLVQNERSWEPKCPLGEPLALCGFSRNSVAVVCHDGTFHKFTFSAEGTCIRSDFDYFLQVGDDDEFLQ